MPGSSGDLPAGFLSRMKEYLGEEYNSFIESYSQESPVVVLLNPNKNKRAFDSIEPLKWHPNAGVLGHKPIFTSDPLFHAGAYYPQEAGSTFLYEILRQTIDPNSNPVCLDLCAAPGGKSLQILNYLNGRGFLLANEVIQKRNSILQEVLTKWGEPNYLVSQNQAYQFEHYQNFFDLVLVDAPCSGEGLFKKTPRAGEEWSSKVVKTCAVRQKEILLKAIEIVKPGGHLIYATCTFSKEENEKVVEEILRNKEFEVADIKQNEKWPELIMDADQPGKGMRFYPHKTKSGGLFYGVLKRHGSPHNDSSITHKGKNLSAEELITISEFGSFKTELIWTEKSRVFFGTKSKPFVQKNRKTGLNIKLSGEYIGEFKNKDFIPSQQLAMRNNNISQRVELDHEQALTYLRKDVMKNNNSNKGWVLVSHQALGLGWLKNIGERANNYYPKNWRIRNF